MFKYLKPTFSCSSTTVFPYVSPNPRSKKYSVENDFILKQVYEMLG